METFTYLEMLAYVNVGYRLSKRTARVDALAVGKPSDLVATTTSLAGSPIPRNAGPTTEARFVFRAWYAPYGRLRSVYTKSPVRVKASEVVTRLVIDAGPTAQLAQMSFEKPR